MFWRAGSTRSRPSTSVLAYSHLAKKHGDERLNKACRRANRFGTCSYKRIESMLKLGLEEEKQPELDLARSIPAHQNIRGSSYYS